MKRVYIYGDRARYGNYRLAIEAAGGQAVFGQSAHSDADVLLLPGGGDMEPWRYGQAGQASRNLEPERDAAELALLEQFVSGGKPVLGICRGFQVLNVFFGGTLCQDIPGHSALDGNDRRHPVSCLKAPEYSAAMQMEAALRGFPEVNSAHHQAIERLGEGLCLLQIAPDGIPEAFAHQTLPVWGVQWHPERLPGRSLPFFQAFLGNQASGIKRQESGVRNQALGIKR